MKAINFILTVTFVIPCLATSMGFAYHIMNRGCILLQRELTIIIWIWLESWLFFRESSKHWFTDSTIIRKSLWVIISLMKRVITKCAIEMNEVTTIDISLRENPFD